MLPYDSESETTRVVCKFSVSAKLVKLLTLHTVACIDKPFVQEIVNLLHAFAYL